MPADSVLCVVLNVRITRVERARFARLVRLLGVPFSAVARAALHIGLEAIEKDHTRLFPGGDHAR